jgi:hypothetical protein
MTRVWRYHPGYHGYVPWCGGKQPAIQRFFSVRFFFR